MRFEIIDRQRFKHVVLLAQIAFAFAASAADKPLLLVVGHPTSHGWKSATDPRFAIRVIDPDVEPRTAAAYRKFASLAGVSGDPLWVIATPHMEPVAASAPDPSFLDRIAARWASDRDGLVAEGGLAVRRSLLAGAPAPKEERLDLRALAASLRYDHIGGGFFRGTHCSIPSFDKSLADQARFANAYLDALRSSSDPLFTDVVQSTLEFVLADLRLPNGLFAAGQNAGSIVARKGPELLEGGQFVWKTEELRNVLGVRTAEIVAYHFTASEEGNVPKECDPAGDFKGRNVLVPSDPAETRTRFHLTQAELDEILRDARARLRDVRSKRPKPQWNPAVVVESNARMISALARAAVMFDEPRYAMAAQRAARALKPKALAYREYAPLVRALLDTYLTTFDPEFLERAAALQRAQTAIAATPGVPEPVAPLLPPFDDRAPAIDAGRVILLAGDRVSPEGEALFRVARKSEALLLLGNTERTRKRLAALMPYLTSIEPVDRHPVITLCEKGSCRTPTADPAVLAGWLN